uniref:Uncharacterized protein n=1 Tax=Timema genevievae TaxID=629358 RepID=A0A7R9JTQ5_TIMGE|nr:unnamed protein product [Timema genevievae]
MALAETALPTPALDHRNGCHAVHVDILYHSSPSVMMNILVISCLVAVALAAPPLVKYGPNEVIPILAESSVVNEDGSFQNSYESGDGTKVQASGVLKSLGPKEEAGPEIQGAYTFITPDGQTLELRYIANENGFQPQASFLPVAPPIPDEIIESLKYNAAHPEEDNLRNDILYHSSPSVMMNIWLSPLPHWSNMALTRSSPFWPNPVLSTKMAASKTATRVGDGTKVQASGVLKSLGPKEEAGPEIQGAYTFITPDGQVLELRYIANENGFQPQASFLPVAPPIPDEIIESLKYNAAHPEEDNLRK